ncbi:MAG TPA: amino acid racemase [Armatimonadota bacterium]|nr:amino acid racemase [Armatimonadota bacterium]HOS42709.1 amino acid racemase [Armatimonadota bacterium]
MTQHIGIVACSAEGAALCYRTIAAEGAALMGRHDHPEVTLHTFPLAQYMAPIYDGDWEGVAELMVASAEKVAGAGADFAICPDNTIHQAFDLVLPRSPIPWLHIAEEVAQEAACRGFRRLALTGTRYLMEGPVYPARVAAQGLDCVIPHAPERAEINRIIFDELVSGVFTVEARDYFQRVIARLMLEEGCDAVILGCTEIPLLITPESSPLPVLDSTRLLARAALRRAIGL